MEKSVRKSKKVSVYLTPQLYRSFKVIAAKRGHPMQWYMLGCINEVVKGERGKGRRRRVGATRKKSPVEL